MRLAREVPNLGLDVMSGERPFFIIALLVGVNMRCYEGMPGLPSCCH